VGFDAGGAVGAKVGGWSRRLPFVAFEGNIWGTFASARSLAGVVVNNHFVGRADVDADINLLNFSGSVLLQRPLGRLRPYAGVGLLVSYAETSHVSLGGFSNASDSTVSPGLILQAGLEYRVNRALGLFSEYRYTYASYDFGSWEASVDLPTHNFLFGAAMHF
jgi:opacity protein-like surface antigen